MGHILGVSLLFIGKVLILNAIWLQGKVETKDVGVFNLIVGALAMFVSASFGLQAEPNIPLMAGGSLFAFTYLWVGINAVRGATDQRALGYYCLLVAIVTIPYAIKAFLGGDIGWTVEWVTYGILWFLFFMVLTLGNQSVMGLTVFMTYLVGIEVWITGWLYLYGYWPFGK
jgi:putative amide transporter protein